VDPALGLKVQFASVADYAPFSMRKTAFVDVGGIDEGLSEPGECGIFSDNDLCMRLWTAGYQVGLGEQGQGLGAGCGGVAREPCFEVAVGKAGCRRAGRWCGKAAWW
jgi:hypothetical protein